MMAGRPDPAGAAEPVSPFPLPGTGFASAATQISFRGSSQAELGPITVRGSRSGNHAGELREHSDAAGVSFLPDEPFEQGELVTVRTRGDVRNADRGDFRFQVARTPTRRPPPSFKAAPTSAGRNAVQRFQSRPDLLPPTYRILEKSPGTAPGHIFLAPKKGSGQNGSMILDERGRLVYFRPGPRLSERVTDLRVQRYRGAPVMTWWQGEVRGGEGTGEGVIVDSSYREVARVRAGNGYAADLHEVVITPRDTALLVAYSPLYRILRIGGRSRRVLVTDAIVQEIDIPTGLVMYEWHSLGHVDLDESYYPRPRSPRIPWDYFHVNAVSEDTDGSLLVTARHTWAVYKIDRDTGSVTWRLGGRRSDFTLPADARFSWPHDGHREADGTVSVFDNAASPPVRERSRVLAIALDAGTREASLKAVIEHPDGLLSPHQGNANRLSNGNVFVGWGGERWISEFTADGRLLFDLRLAKGNDSYRAYRAEWTGQPRGRPRLAARTNGDGRVDVHASWNGATEVARWRILAGPDPGSLRPVGVSAWTGFETTIGVETRARYVAAQALDDAGRVLRTSRPKVPRSPPLRQLP